MTHLLKNQLKPVVWKVFIFTICIQATWAQWKGYFSYNNIVEISGQNNIAAVASDNTIFVHNVATGSVETFNTVDGLSSENISTIYYKPENNTVYIGYQNGLLSVFNIKNKRIVNRFDIVNNTGVSINKKKINSIYEYNNLLYLATDYGITLFNPQNNLFGNSFFIGNNASETEVLSLVVFNNEIYAVTQFGGVRKADVNNPFLINFENWSSFSPNAFSKIIKHQNSLLLISNNGVHSVNNNTINLIYSGFAARDIASNDQAVVVTGSQKLLVFNQNLTLSQDLNLNQIQGVLPDFTKVGLFQNFCLVGTSNNGLLKSGLPFSFSPEFILPAGPLSNNAYKVYNTPSGSDLWIVYGEASATYNPFPLRERGLSKLNNNVYTHIPFSNLLGARSLVNITTNPNDETQVLLTSGFDGLLRLQNNTGGDLINSTNSNLPTQSGLGNRIFGMGFDNNNELWVTNSLVQNNILSVYRDNQWVNFNAQAVVSNFNQHYVDFVVDKNNTKWIATQLTGVFGFNETANPRFKPVRAFNNETGFIQEITSIALDKRGQLWIGSRGGLRILRSIDQFLTNPVLENTNIVIEEDGLGQELLNSQFVTKIVVDGSNNKWIGTADQGVFLLSFNGQETLLRFTAQNSPLPSNSIKDININQVTGEVFFLTTKGIVSYQGTATAPRENLENVVIYPNPVRPEFKGTVKITGLIDNANIKITDISGNLVHETTSSGGTIEWDTTAFGKYKVASGVYMMFIAADDLNETKVKKIMIVR